MPRWTVLMLCIIGVLGAQTRARAHDPGLSMLTVRHGEAEVRYRLLVDDAALPTDSRSDGCDPHGTIELSLSGQRLSVVETCRRADAQHTAFEGHAEVLLGGELKVSLALLRRLPRGHRSYLRVVDAAGQLEFDRMLSLGAEDVTLGVRAASSTGFFLLGVTHILTGFDHLLFLGVLLLGVDRVRHMAAIVSTFTLAHSLTLALATLRILVLPSTLVEALIAASVVFVALRACARRQPETERLLVTFAFGLVHGVGFASALDALRAAGGGEDVVGPLLRFNLGVEVGQLAVGLLCLPLLAWTRRWSSRHLEVHRWLAGTIAMVGLFWLIQRSMGLFVS